MRTALEPQFVRLVFKWWPFWFCCYCSDGENVLFNESGGRRYVRCPLPMPYVRDMNAG